MTTLLLALLAWAPLAPADELAVLPEKLEATTPREMMVAHWLRLGGEALDRHDAAYEELKTPEQVAAHRQRMRQFFLDALGGLPERCPLNARVLGRVARDGYAVEKVIFESQPRHFVTAALYLPDGRRGVPGVLVPCGHSANGKAAKPYQQACILLARHGLAALCYDPIEQGERGQLLDAAGKNLSNHSLVGVGSTLLGRNTATFRIWDGMRAIDYLQSRPEVDPKRIGCTGNSGGGTLTSYLMALDDRIEAAAPSCYLTSFRRLLETIGPQDAEQNIFGQVAFGMDHRDYILMRSPKPTLMCCATHDFFDIQGAWDTFRKAKRIYARLGYAERVDLVEADERHGFTPLLRQGAARWMRRWLAGVDEPVWDEDPEVLADPEIQCTTEGQVMRLPGARSVYELNADLADRLADQRRQRWDKADGKTRLAEVRRTTGIRALGFLAAPTVEKAGHVARDGYRIEKLIFRVEPDVWLPALEFLPAKPNGRACLYLNAAGKQADSGPGGAIETLVRQGQTVLAVDLGGLGETASNRRLHKLLGFDWLNLYRPYLLGTSYVACWAEEILACANWLAHQPGNTSGRVELVSVGRTGPAALHAAVLEPALFAGGTIRQALASWDLVVRTPLASNQLVNVVHGVLRTYDLPDLVAMLPAGKFTVVDPLDAAEQPLAK